MAPDWIEGRACADEPTELFFPDGERGRNSVTIELAKMVCARCPVRYPCLKTALDNGEYGIWGGTTESERRNLKNKTRREQYATPGKLRELLEVELPACIRCGKHRKPKADDMCATCVTETNKEKVSA